jgi:PAS domain S-box-containing protein
MKSLKVLLVTEDSSEAKKICETIESWGYNCPSVVKSIDKVISIAYEFDVILMDINFKSKFDNIIESELNFPLIYLNKDFENQQIDKKLFRKDHTILYNPFSFNEYKSSVEIAIYKHNILREFKNDGKFSKEVLDAFHDSLLVIDTSGKILDINEASTKKLERTKDDMVGSNYKNFIPAESAELSCKYIERTIKLNKIIEFEDVMNGTCFHHTLIPLSDNGEVKSIVINSKDITKRKDDEKAFITINSYNRILIDASIDAFITVNPNGEITDANKAFETVTGYNMEQVIGTDFLNYFTDPNYTLEGFKKVFKNGSVENYPVKIKHKEGNILDVLVNASLYYDEKGGIIGVFAAIRDITELKIAEKALKQANQYNRSLIEANIDPLVTIGPEGKVTDVNKATEKVTGFSRNEIIGKDFSNYFTEPEKAKEGYEEVFSKGFVKDYPLEIQHIDGGITPVLYNASIYKDESGEVVGVFAAARDITKRKKIENELLRANRALRVIRYSDEIMTHATSEYELMNKICNVIVENGGYKFAWIGFAEQDEKKTLKPVASAGFDGEFLTKTNESWIEDESSYGPVGNAIKSGNTIVCRDITTNGSFSPWREEAKSHGFLSLIVLPLKIDEEVYGAMGIYADEVDAFDPGEVKLLEELSNDLSFGLKAMRARFEKEKMERALRESEAKFRSFIETAEEGVWIIDEQAKTNYLNDAMLKILGYTRNEMMGHSFFEFMDNENKIYAKEKLERRKKGFGEKYDFKFLHKNGSSVWTIISAKPLYKDNKFIGSLGMLTDITKRKKMEEELKKSLNEKEMLLKEIHHRVKNNLMVISSLLNLQSNYIKNKEDFDMFLESQNRAKSMALIHELLYRSDDLKRIDFGDYMDNLIKDLFNTYVDDPQHLKLNLDLQNIKLDINTSIPLGLIVNELVSNSLKHAFSNGKEGEINISLKVEKDEYILIVGDNGVGIPDDIDFKNTDSLGLQLINNLTKQIDGKIELDKSHGTEFSIRFEETSY